MTIHDLVDQLLGDTRWSLYAFLPELILCATVLAMLLLRLFDFGRRLDMAYVTLAGALAGLYFCASWIFLDRPPLAPAGFQDIDRAEIFTGMLVYDQFSVYVRGVLLLFLALFAIFTRMTQLPDREDSADIFTLVVGATIGMCLMASANHLIMVFMAVEIASVPSYALAGMQKGRRRSSEAALKYSVYGAGAAGVMLYGISLLAGLLNTAHLPTMAVRLAELDLPAILATGQGREEMTVLAVGAIMVMVGLGFKLSAVPFHFWCPDVFEGAAAEVGAFLSIASKAAALALLVRVAIGIGAAAPERYVPGGSEVALTHAADPPHLAPRSVAEEHFVALQADDAADAAAEQEADAAAQEAPASAESAHAESNAAESNEGGSNEAEATDATPHTASTPVSRREINEKLFPARDFLAKLIALLAAITCTFGNLAAYGQSNMKRLMAYSTIAHAGYMMMPVPALLAIVGVDAGAAEDAVAALCIYMGIYLFMNLGVFAIIAFLRDSLGTEEIAAYAGLIRRRPLLALALCVLFFGLIGLPPLAGFIGKFYVFASLADGYTITVNAGRPATYLIVLLAIGCVNTAISLFYYLRIVKLMTMSGEPEDRPPPRPANVYLQGAFVGVVTLCTILLFFWSGLNELAARVASNLLT